MAQPERLPLRDTVELHGVHCSAQLIRGTEQQVIEELRWYLDHGFDIDGFMVRTRQGMFFGTGLRKWLNARA